MERRRLALICSHLRQVRPRPRPSESFSTSRCDGGGHEADSSKRKDVENSSCVFCSIILGDSPAFKLYEDDSCLCILDSNPLCHGHSLIIPKLHFSSLEATPPLVVAAMCSTVPFLSKAIMKATQSDSFNLVVNSGTAAGQVIFHTHLHIIPRKADDRLWPSESFRRQPLKMNQDTASLAHRVREQLSFPVEHGDSCETKLAG